MSRLTCAQSASCSGCGQPIMRFTPRQSWMTEDYSAECGGGTHHPAPKSLEG